MHSQSDRPLEIELELPVRTYDIDFAGIVSNIVFVRWLEDLRLAILDAHLPIQQQMIEGFAPVILKTEIDYRAALTIHDRVTGRMWLDSMRKARYALCAEIVAEDRVAATARQQGCFVNLSSKRPIAVPGQLSERFASWPSR